ncbi:MAG: trigger factor, partial [Gammaproteobacteria bacterium]
PLEFRAKFEVYPEIKLADLEGMTVEKRVATVTDADVERVLEDLRKQHIQWKKTDRSAQKGDRLTIDFDGSVEGQPLERGSAEDFPLILGEANMIPGFEDGLIGMAVGEERTLHLKFPDEYHAKDIAGKPVEFKIKAKEIAESCLPPLDEQFALLMGVKEGGMEKLHQEVRRTMVNELDSRLEMELKQSVLDKLLERNPLEVPKALVERETQAMQEDFMKRMGGKQPVSAKKENYAHLFTDQAKRRITIS